MRSHWIWISPLFLFGCATLLPLKSPQFLDLAVYPKVNPYTQTIVPNYTLGSIATLSILPHIETSPGTYAPISAVTGNPTTVGAQDVLCLHQASPSIDPNRPFVIRRLKPNSKYRIMARAYDSNNVLISADASSYTDVAITSDDAPRIASLPVNLVNVPFGATASVTLNTVGRFDYIKTTLYLVAGNSQVGLSSTTRANPELVFGNLQGNTSYRLVAEAYKLGGVIASQSLNLNIGNDNAPAATSISLNVPYVVSTIAGGATGSLDAVGTSAQFNWPRGIAVDGSGNLYVADRYNYRVRKITVGGVVSTLAGSTSGTADGAGTAAQFNWPCQVAVDSSGYVYVADFANHRIRKITPDGVVSTFAGSSVGTADGAGTAAQFNCPAGVALDAAGNIYVGDDSNHRIRKITPAGVVSTLAGSSVGSANGVGTAAQFNDPAGVAVDPSGNVYVAEGAGNRIRKVTPAGVVTTLAGSGATGVADGVGTAAQFSKPLGIAVDNEGNVYVPERDTHRIRKITAAGVVTTIAGSGTAGVANGTGLQAQFYMPRNVAVDALGNVYIADTENNLIRVLK